MYSTNRQAEYINAVTTVSEIDATKLRFKKASDFNNFYSTLVPEPEVK